MRLATFVSLVTVTVTSALVACSSGDTRQSQSAVTPAADGGKKSPDKVTSGQLGAITGNRENKDAGAKPEPKPSPDLEQKTCGSAALCASDCPDEEGDACTDACLANLPEVEVVKLQSVATCIGESGCADDDCIQATCGSEIQACIGG